jgi:two-component system, OmpR family, sensor histidine kinase BaeS
VLVSALARLALYQQAYGWTELRFYALATIGWLALAVVAAVVTLARDQVRWLPHAVWLSGVAVALAVNVVGPQAFVADRNVERLLRPELVPEDGSVGLDVSYAVWLGDDAVPALITALPALPPHDRALAVDALARRLRRLEASRPETWGWQGWNLARVRALELLRAEPSLRSEPSVRSTPGGVTSP